MKQTIIAAILALSPLAANAVVIYDEAVSGDIQGDQNTPALLGAFVLGDNTILGFDSIGSDTSSQGDTFGLTLAANQIITSIVLSISNNNNTADRFTTTVFAAGFTQVQQFIQNPGFTGAVNFNPFATQTPGQYNFSTQFVTGNQIANGFAWQWSIQVAAVPEPGTLALLGLGLAGMGLSRRKKEVWN